MSHSKRTEGDHIKISPFQMNTSTLITARSYLIDRAVPNCEIIHLPMREIPGGEIAFSLVDQMPQIQRRVRLRDRLLRRHIKDSVPLEGDLSMDCRIMSPENWSHFLNIHAPLAVELMRRLGKPELVLILPANSPTYILRAADHLGLRVQLTDAPVDGPAVLYELRDYNITRPDRRNWLLTSGIIDRLQDVSIQKELPRRVFLARKKTRNISNQAEIEAMLVQLDFQTIYPEELSVADQFALFNHAETIVAVHGAGLAPLLYRHPDSRLRQLVEILPCGHMTDVFRMMAQQVGCDWIGVRGKLKGKYIQPAYKIGDGLFAAFSMDSFEVDPVSLERALSWSQTL